MIKSIHISNYALIDKLEIELTGGLNIITGETGAGKSIILGALSLLLGGRADTKVVTDSSKKSVIEAVVEIGDKQWLKSFYEENSLDANNDGTVILRREIAPNSRSRAFINDTPVNLSVLENLSKELIDIHSQHQNLLLADPEFQLRIIDTLANNTDVLAEYRTHYNDYRLTLRRYSQAKKKLESTREREEELRSRLDTIESLNLQPDEQEELEREKEVAGNFAYIKESLGYIVGQLSQNDDSALSMIKACVRESADIKDMIADGEQLYDRLNSAFLELADIAASYESLDSDLTADPDRFEAIEERLNLIYKLENKYKVNTVGEILDIADKIGEALDQLDSGEEHLRQLQAEAKAKRATVLELAKKLSASRRREAQEFASTLQEKAVPLGMKNLRAVVDFSYTPELTADGIDKLEFRFAFNKNQEPLSIKNSASGGEISRLMLVVKSILARKMEFPTIIFDEVDTGVSGEVADRMGAMMLDIAADIQVLAITHLPQVAAKGHTHFKVYKEDDEHKTHTKLTKLSADERINEIAVMLSGTTVDEAAIANAKSLLNQH